MAEKQLSLDFVPLPDKLEVKSEEITKVYTYVILGGQKFEILDLFDTLDEISTDPSSTHITDDSMVKVLKQFGVIESNSVYHGVILGNNFNKFYTMVSEIRWLK